MSTHRFYISPEQWNPSALILHGSEAHHCIDVLRLNIGARVIVFDGCGTETTNEIIKIGKVQVQLKTLLVSKSEPLRCALTLAQAVPKGKNMDLILQKATELGVSRIVPLLSERTVVQLKEEEARKRRKKWQQVVIEAAKQCGQNWLPEVAAPVTPEQFFAELGRYETPLIASLQANAQSFRTVFADFRERHGRRSTSALILIGPEGDFTPAESSLARIAGCIPVTLGPIVLRTETAAIYSLSVLAYELQGVE